MGSSCCHEESVDKEMHDVSNDPGKDGARNKRKKNNKEHQASSSRGYAPSNPANNNKENRDVRRKDKVEKQGPSSNNNTHGMHTDDSNNDRRYKELLNKERYDNDQLKRQIQKLIDDKNDLENSFKKELQDKRNEISQHKKDTSKKEARFTLHIESLTRQHDALKKELEKVKKEKDELLTRYSALAGSKLTDGNANIADLSDENRPTKLSERYSELYDNEWTDALTILSSDNSRNEEDVCSILARVFCTIYSTCRKEAEDELKRFISATKIMHKVDTLPQELIKTAKDKRKKSLGVDREQIKKAYAKDMVKEIPVEEQNKIEMFLVQSIDLCWRMAIQDPPVHVDTNLSMRDTSLNKNLFKPYTSDGKFIDFVVWPTLYLNEGGSVLCKGIAQGKKSQTPEQAYDNVDITARGQVSIVSSEHDQDRNKIAEDTKVNSNKENDSPNTAPESHVISNEAETSDVAPAPISFSTSQAITNSDSQSKSADASLQNIEPKTDTDNANINTTGNVRDSESSTAHKSLGKSGSYRDIKSQSHPIDDKSNKTKMKLPQWQDRQRPATVTETQVNGKHRSVINTFKK